VGPAVVPAREHRLDRITGLVLELAVAPPVGLLPVAGQEVAPARPQVAPDVLDDQPDAVGVLVEGAEERVRRGLRERTLREFLLGVEPRALLLAQGRADVVGHVGSPAGTRTV